MTKLGTTSFSFSLTFFSFQNIMTRNSTRSHNAARSLTTERAETQASSSHREATSPLVVQTSQAPSNTIDRITPTLVGLQWAQRELFELIVELRAKPAPAPTTLIIKKMSDEPTSKVMPTNADNLSATRQPASTTEEPTTLLTCSDIRELIRQEKGVNCRHRMGTAIFYRGNFKAISFWL